MMMRAMHSVNGLIGLLLLTLCLLHFFIPNSLLKATLYGAGAILAFVTLSPRGLGIYTARLLAVCTTALMFFYFAGFFRMAPHFNEHWYHSGAALEALGMLLSAFAMISVLSSYSCMLKADCDHRLQKSVKRPAFFSVPENMQKNS